MIQIGTSGYHYMHWRGPFYPPQLKPSQFFDYYVRHFRTVEINNSFYKLPSEETFAAWRACTPDDFVFAVKASRFITHMKKLKLEPGQGLFPLFERVRALGDKLGPILFQLPPLWRYNEERFASFLAALPKTHRYAFEFRHPSWYNESAYALLRQHGAAFCLYELAGHQSPVVVTSRLVYIRLHGPTERAYQGKYPIETLADWALRIQAWAAKGHDVFCYFDNDQAGYAAQDALLLKTLVTRGRACGPVNEGERGVLRPL